MKAAFSDPQASRQDYESRKRAWRSGATGLTERTGRNARGQAYSVLVLVMAIRDDLSLSLRRSDITVGDVEEAVRPVVEHLGST